MTNATGSTTVVVGFDFSDPAHLALDAAFAWARMHSHADIHVLVVLDETKREATYRTADKFRDEIVAIVDSMTATHPAPDVRAFAHARIGNAADTILALAAEVRADLICVGSHGISGLPRLVLGSVSEKVLRGADCPVLAMRPKTYEQADADAELSPDPPCPDCLSAQRTADDTDARCEAHAGRASMPRRYHHPSVPRQGAIRHATARPDAPMGPHPSAIDDRGPRR